jgi:hypothetical protein
MEPNLLTRLQTKMARCLGQEKEQNGGKFSLVFVAQGPYCKYLEGKNKSQHPNDCSSYEYGTFETIMHKFWQCPRARTTWEQASSFFL